MKVVILPEDTARNAGIIGMLKAGQSWSAGRHRLQPRHDREAGQAC